MQWVGDLKKGGMMCCMQGAERMAADYALYRKFETNIPRNETARPRPNFCIHVSLSDLYIPMIDPAILLYWACGPIVGMYISFTDT